MFTAWRRRRNDEADRRVLTCLQHGERSTYEIISAAGMSAARTYLALTRLESTATILSRWDDGPHQPGRGRRRLYRPA